MRQDSEPSCSSQDSKEKKCDFSIKDEPIDIKPESIDTDYSNGSEVSCFEKTIWNEFKLISSSNKFSQLLAKAEEEEEEEVNWN